MSLYGFEGTYVGSGTDPYEKGTYTVTATFTKDENGVYQATWEELEKGVKSLYIGTGFRQADSMSFVFQNTEDASDVGLQIYKIKGNALEGRYVSIHQNLIGDEKLTLKK
jgi:HKD family nuclease